MAARVSGFMKAPPPVARTCAPFSSKRENHAAFAITEMGFAMFGKNIGDGFAGGFFNFSVGIDEGQAHAFGQPAANGGFTCPHQTHQHDGAIAGIFYGSLQHAGWFFPVRCSRACFSALSHARRKAG